MVERLLAPYRLAKRHYGANPLQLLALLACFSLAGYAFFRASMGPLPLRMAVWFAAAVIGHDLVLFPLYALADRSWHEALKRLPFRRSAAQPLVPVINYVRVPAVLSAMLLIAFWGSISNQGERSFHYASDKTFPDYLARWLITTGVLFAVSAVLYALRLRRASRVARAEVAS